MDTWLQARAELDRDVYYVETGGVRAPAQQHELVLQEVHEIARSLGFPQSGSTVQRAAFDTQSAKSLFGRLRPAQTKDEAPMNASGELLHPDFWAWLALRKLPDIVVWRFGGRAPDDRFLGGFRNCFYRLWRRAWLLEGAADDRWSVLDAMTEDAFVSVVERPGLSANRIVARLIGECWLETSTKIGRERMEPVNREAMKRMSALAPVLYLDGLQRDALRSLILAQYLTAAERARRAKPGAAKPDARTSAAPG